MKIFYWPISPVHVNQPFGGNLPCVKDFGLPTQSVVTGADNNTCPPGYDKLYAHFGLAGHNGMDLAATKWQQVYASREGRVIEKQTDIQKGLGIGILHGPYEGKYYRTRYWHLIALDVDIGDTVKTGSFIGYADNTGYSSGDHLHFELMETDQDGNPLNPNNGYFGAIDPEPLIDLAFARDVSSLNTMVETLASLVDKLADLLRNR